MAVNTLVANSRVSFYAMDCRNQLPKTRDKDRRQGERYGTIEGVYMCESVDIPQSDLHEDTQARRTSESENDEECNATVFRFVFPDHCQTD